MLTMATVTRRLVPMTRWQGLLGKPAPVDEPRRTLAPPYGLEATVARHINAAERRLPFHTNCLDEATAGQLMLRRRNRPGAVVIGLSSGEPGEQWGAHAWLVGRTGVITGRRVALDYAPASIFAPDEVLEADTPPANRPPDSI